MTTQDIYLSETWSEKTKRPLPYEYSGDVGKREHMGEAKNGPDRRLDRRRQLPMVADRCRSYGNQA